MFHYAILFITVIHNLQFCNRLDLSPQDLVCWYCNAVNIDDASCYPSADAFARAEQIYIASERWHPFTYFFAWKISEPQSHDHKKQLNIYNMHFKEWGNIA